MVNFTYWVNFQLPFANTVVLLITKVNTRGLFWNVKKVLGCTNSDDFFSDKITCMMSK